MIRAAPARILGGLGWTCFLTFTPILHAGFTHFEARHCHPIDHTPDGKLLLAVNAPEGRLSVFSCANPNQLPLLIAEIPVGLEPVSVRARSNGEAWVVNEVSDSVSIVNLDTAQVSVTVPAADEPADVVFCDGKAFVSCARNNRIVVIDATTHAIHAGIPLDGMFPRSLTLSPDGLRLFAGCFLSGNNTTTLHFRQAPAPPLPENPALPPAPQTALIVPDTDARIPYDVTDHDIVEIDTATCEVIGYRESLGTNILALDCAQDGTLWATATEARNLIRFEPNLNGVFQQSRVVRMDVAGTRIIDLNPHATIPRLDPALKERSLAQPMSVLADADGAWIAAFGSDRIARVSASGDILTRIDLRSSFPSLVRGPRGISRHPATGRLAVYNKLSSTISLIDPGRGAVVGEIQLASHNPIAADALRGRGLFYDSRSSGNGTVCCGSCHFDADIDGVAWDLGDPSGSMQMVLGSAPSIGEPGGVERLLHPMKGPMVTQSLRGIAGAGPFHWRGDKATIQEFNSSFAKLQAGDMLPTADMDAVVAYIESLRNHPNPNRLPDNSLPASLDGGDPTRGKMRFEQLNTCTACHSGPRGTNHVLDEFTSVLTRQPVKNATLEHVYKKIHYTPELATSLSGYGFTHDGTGHDIPRGHEYDQDRFHLYPNAEADVMAYILCTETGTSPAVGRQDQQPSSLLENQALAGRCDLTAHAIIHGERRSFLYQPASGTYLPDSSAEPALSATQLTAMASSIRFLAVPPGDGARLSIDRNGDGVPNRDTPAPILGVDAFLQPVVQPDQADWFIETSRDLQHWESAAPPLPALRQRFFRLHRTW